MQSHGIQFYLGMFDSEEEAARAYDRKAREEKGGKTLTNFENGEDEYGGFHLNMNGSPYQYGGDDNEEYEAGANGSGRGSSIGNTRARTSNEADFYNNKRIKTDEQEHSRDAKRLDYQSTTENMRILWDRHCQIAQRLLLAKAAQAKLQEFQSVAPDSEKAAILKALNEEIVLLVVVKAQLEEAVSRCYLLGLDLNTAAPAPTVAPPALAAAAPTVPVGFRGAVFKSASDAAELASSSSSSSSSAMPLHFDALKLPIHQLDRSNSSGRGGNSNGNAPNAAATAVSLAALSASSAYPLHYMPSTAGGSAPQPLHPSISNMGSRMMDYSSGATAAFHPSMSMMSGPTTGHAGPNPFMLPYPYNNHPARPNNATGSSGSSSSNHSRQYMGMGHYTVNGKRPNPTPLPTASGHNGNSYSGANPYNMGHNHNLNASLGVTPMSAPMQFPQVNHAAAPSSNNNNNHSTSVAPSGSAHPPMLPLTSSDNSPLLSAPVPIPLPAVLTTPNNVVEGSLAPPTGSAGSVINMSSTLSSSPAIALTATMSQPHAGGRLPPPPQLPLPIPLDLSVLPTTTTITTTTSSSSSAAAVPFGKVAVVDAAVATPAIAVPSTAAVAAAATATLSPPPTAPPKSTAAPPKHFAHKVVQGQHHQQGSSTGQAANASKKGKRDEVAQLTAAAAGVEPPLQAPEKGGALSGKAHGKEKEKEKDAKSIDAGVGTEKEKGKGVSAVKGKDMEKEREKETLLAELAVPLTTTTSAAADAKGTRGRPVNPNRGATKTVAATPPVPTPTPTPAPAPQPAVSGASAAGKLSARKR